ncbi:MAG: hypothetical protein ACTSU6_00320 [Candidatus Njordarchaeales archaeon]
MKDGYTIEEIQEWFLYGEHNKKMMQPLALGNANYTISTILDELSGLFLQEHNTVIVLYRGVLHNPLGPAKVILTKEGKPYHSIFARDGEIIQWDGFEAKVRGIQIKSK